MRLLRRLCLALLAVLTLVLSACGDAEPAAEPAADEATSGEVDDATPADEQDAPADEQDAPADKQDEQDETDDAPTGIAGPPAPDFTLDLADGDEFVLSAEQRSVYLVFWAEW